MPARTIAVGVPGGDHSQRSYIRQVRRTPVEMLEAVAGSWLGPRLANLLPEAWTALRTPDDRVPPPPSAFASFGAGSWVVPTTRVPRPGRVRVGAAVVVMEDSALVVENDQAMIELGDGVVLARFVTIQCSIGVTIGANVLTSDYVAITDSWGPAPDAPLPPQPVVIEAGAYLGAGSIVGPGVRVGRGAFVGEGAVVLNDVPPHAVVYGNPATVRAPSGG
jgi:acetyltransferase-like isoleucine patch superfamily enzyme